MLAKHKGVTKTESLSDINVFEARTFHFPYHMNLIWLHLLNCKVRLLKAFGDVWQEKIV